MTVFVAVCEAQGFAPAARRLGLSPSVVTRQVAGLEAHLGVRLLQRTTRSLRLTEAGTRFLERARRIVAEVEEAEQSAQAERASPVGRLVIAAPLIYGRMHVAPAVSRYLERYPGVSAELQLSDRLVGLVEDGIDVAVRIGHLADSGLVARRIGETRRVLVASPKYLARRGAPQHPRELAEHDLIAFTNLAPGPTWRFVVAGKDLRVAVQPRYATNSGDAAIARARAGGGLCLALAYQVREAIDRGTLVELLPTFAPPALPIHAVFPTSRLLSGKVRAFLELL
ncbi:MAG TPA: LysR family transcriptional regulator [Nannocystis sp.]